MTAKFKKVFGTQKPIIAMVHFGAMPGSPLHDAKAGLNGIVEGARKDLLALQATGVDAVMFGNEMTGLMNSRLIQLLPLLWPLPSGRCRRKRP